MFSAKYYAKKSDENSINPVEMFDRENIKQAPSWLLNCIKNSYSLPLKTIYDSTSLDETDSFNSWDFSALDENENRLLSVVLAILKPYYSYFNIEDSVFTYFVSIIMFNYPQNPYHNFNHAVDVLQCIHYLISINDRIKNTLDHLEIFALMIAAIGHDIGHPSFTNAFIKDINHPLRILFNDISVLEQYHSFLLFSILENSNLASFWNKFTAKDRCLFREIVVKCIISTDMKNHFEIIKNIEQEFSNKTFEYKPLLFGKKLSLCIMLIKLADLSNVARPFNNAKHWAIRIMDEFDHQVYLIVYIYRINWNWFITDLKLVGLLAEKCAEAYQKYKLILFWEQLIRSFLFLLINTANFNF